MSTLLLTLIRTETFSSPLTTMFVLAGTCYTLSRRLDTECLNNISIIDR